MKRHSSRHLCMSVTAGLLFILAQIVFSQGEVTALSSSDGFDVIYRQIVAGGLQTDPNVPVLHMLGEPQVTQSDSNMVFWQALGDTVKLPWGQYLLSGCVIVVQAASDTGFKEGLETLPSDKFPRGNANGVVFKHNAQHVGKRRFYRSALVVPMPGQPFGVQGAWSAVDSSISTVPDVVPPVVSEPLQSYQIIDGMPQEATNGWFRSSHVEIQFKGLKDGAGIDSAWIAGAVTKGIKFVQQDTVKGRPAPSPVGGIFAFQRQPDGIYNFSFNAADAAYTPDSHGGTKAVWNTKLGNRALNLASDQSDTVRTIRIDTKPPVIRFPNRDIFTSNDRKDGAIELVIEITDLLSGIDVNSITVDFTPKLDFTQSVVVSDAQTVLLVMRILNVAKDVNATSAVSAADLAGNGAAASKIFRFIVEPPKLESFRLSDLNFGDAGCLVPAAGYTNSPIVRIDMPKLSEGSKTADSLQLCDEDNCVIKPWPMDGFINFDLREVKPGLASGDTVILSINALDRYGNLQSNGPARSIIFDDQPPQMQLAVESPNPIDKDARNGAHPGWTRDRTVQVSIKPNEALYKIEQSAPTPLCRPGEPLDFPVELFNRDGEYELRCQAGDYAGNTSNIAAQNIRLDTDIFQPVSEDFSYGDDRSRDGHVKICLKDAERIADRSRIVVNDVLYPFGVDACVSVPENISGYTVSIIDSSGNETFPVKLSQPCPNFGIKLADNLANPRTASEGYTNNAVVQWDTTFTNFRWTKLLTIVFYNETFSDSVVLASNEKSLDLSKLYNPLVSGTEYTVRAKANVRNWPQSDPVAYASAAIFYDAAPPAIGRFVLRDTADAPFAASVGFTNDAGVQLKIEVNSADVDSVLIEGPSGAKIDGSATPCVLPYQSFYSVALPVTGEFHEGLQFFGTVWDRAGNESSRVDTVITFIKWDVLVAVPTDTLYRPDTKTEPETVPVVVDCRQANYLLSSRVTAPNGSVLGNPIRLKFEDSACRALVELDVATGGEGNYSIQLVDKAGNASATRSVFVDVQEKPEITLSLFDFSTFPYFESPANRPPNDLERSDSLFTNGSGGKVVALTKKVKGDWQTIKFYIMPDDPNPVFEGAVADAVQKIDLRTLPITAAENETRVVTVRAEVENSLGMSDFADASIILDTKPPIFHSFSGAPLTADSLAYLISYSGSDEAPGEPAGMVLTDRIVDPDRRLDAARAHYIPLESASGMVKVNLLPFTGTHTLTAYLLDQATADQNRPDSMAARVKRGDVRWLSQSSEIRQFSVRLNPVEVSNFPNPFDPNHEHTKLIFPINSDDGSTVRITILDAFGNLVHQKEVVCTKRFSGGDHEDNSALIWDGHNDRGDIVANGGYICIIDVLKTGERYMRKIAVLKRQ